MKEQEIASHLFKWEMSYVDENSNIKCLTISADNRDSDLQDIPNCEFNNYDWFTLILENQVGQFVTSSKILGNLWRYNNDF